MRVLIVDDERVARVHLAAMLERVQSVRAWAEAEDAEQAVAAIASFAPDVLLLDIHMPGRDGVDLARSLPSSVGVVFVTADPGHAVDAFEIGAIDYLLKPVRLARLERALERVSPGADPQQVRLLCRARTGLRVVDARRIPRFRAEDKYTVFTQDGHDYLLNESLDALEARLPHTRVHRAELVDLGAVVRTEPGVLVLADGQRAAVSRRRWAAVRRALALG